MRDLGFVNMRHAKICFKLLEMVQMLARNMASVLRVHYVVLRIHFNQKIKTDSFILCLNKLNKQTLFMIEQTDL